MPSLGQVNIPDPSGTKCCDCGVQNGCSCGAGPCGVLCQTISGPGGKASFCGFAEYVPSVPPNYYLSRTLSGGSSTNCGGPSCSPVTCTQSYTYQGSNTIDPVTCVETDNATITISGSCSVNTGTFARSDVQVGDAQGFVTGVSFNFSDQYPTPYQHNLVNGGTPGACILSGSGFTGCIQPSSNGGNGQLSSMETYQQAVNRAISGQAWSAVGDCSKAFSSVTPPAAGSRSFKFTLAQVQVTFYGVPGSNHKLIVSLGQRGAGSSDPLVPYGQLIFSITVPPSGNAASSFQQIPLVAGSDIVATGCTVQF